LVSVHENKFAAKCIENESFALIPLTIVLHIEKHFRQQFLIIRKLRKMLLEVNKFGNIIFDISPKTSPIEDVQ